MITITAFKWVPEFAQGYVRDLRIRWACKEAGIPYALRLISQDDKNSDSYRREQPFSQVPVLQDGELSIFESGSILVYLGEKSNKLLPADAKGRARAITWTFAALSSVEPFVNSFYVHDQNAKSLELLRKRLEGLSVWLEGREFLEDTFTIGDIAMSTVLRDLNDSPVLQEYPTLANYLGRCESRPAFQESLKEQLDNFKAAS